MSVDLLCPKCRAPMRSFERNKVTIEQCQECRGIFLDRGELERLIAAEASFVDRDTRDDRFGGHHGSSDRKKGRKGFLGELFD